MGDEPDFELQELQDTTLDGAIDYGNLIPVYESRTGQTEQVGVRWTGAITVPTSGEYTFHAIGDNGFRLWIDDQQLIDFWVNEWDVEQSSDPVWLEAGEKYPFTLENFQAIGGAHMQLSWSGPGIEKSIVPLEAFTPPEEFEVYPAVGSVGEGGSILHLSLPGTPGGLDGLLEHLTVTVDLEEIDLAQVEAADGQSLQIRTAVPIYAGTTVRLSYDGKGELTAGGEAVPTLDIPVPNSSTHRMTTQWADDVDPENPLPEYPRPQMERSQWQNLNGRWQFEAATETSETPFGSELAEEVIVPFPIESQLSQVMRHEDHMIYRRTFEVPEDWDVGARHRLLLHFGAVDHDATVFVNGQQVAEHSGGYDSFSADITDAVTGGSNELIVRVTDTTSKLRGKQSANPSGIFYTASSGIWQTVWMEPVPKTHIDELEITPDIEADTLTVKAASESANNGARVTVRVIDADGTQVGEATGSANSAIAVPVPDPHLWSPDHPYLYDVEVSLSYGNTTDTVNGYAGMRSIDHEVIDGVQRITLNGNQTFLLSTLDQGFWPDGVYTAPTDEALAWDIEQTKKLGFNTIRKHIKVEPARWYYHADRLGMLVWQDMPSGDIDDQEDFRPELMQMVEQLDAHPSIIGWVIFNEGWGEWSRTDTGELAEDVQAADPTRLVNAASGVNCCASQGDSGKGDIIDYHMYTGPAFPHPDKNRAAIDGEHGGFSLSIPGHTWPGGSVNPYGEVDSKEALTEAYVANTAQLIRPAQDYLSGSVYTQITDVEGEVNGFWTYDRRVEKMDAERVRAINEKVIEVGSQPRELPDPGTSEDGIAYWQLNEGDGEQATDATGNGHTLTLDGATWAEGVTSGDTAAAAAQTALHFDGTGQNASASLPELDTTASYSVSAWVRMDELPDNYATFASVDGLSGRSAFFLQYGQPTEGFAFSFPDGPRAIAPITPELGTWYHLVGVRDAEADTISLYLNGTEAATVDAKAGAASAGTFVLGRGQWDGDPTDFLNGAVDEVHVFDRALDAEEVAALADPPTKPAGALVELTQSLEGYADSGAVAGPIAHQLGNALELARHHLKADRTRQAERALERFIRHLDTPKRPDTLTQEARDDLRGQAQAIIDLLP